MSIDEQILRQKDLGSRRPMTTLSGPLFGSSFTGHSSDSKTSAWRLHRQQVRRRFCCTDMITGICSLLLVDVGLPEKLHKFWMSLAVVAGVESRRGSLLSIPWLLTPEMMTPNKLRTVLGQFGELTLRCQKLLYSVCRTAEKQTLKITKPSFPPDRRFVLHWSPRNPCLWQTWRLSPWSPTERHLQGTGACVLHLHAPGQHVPLVVCDHLCRPLPTCIAACVCCWPCMWRAASVLRRASTGVPVAGWKPTSNTPVCRYVLLRLSVCRAQKHFERHCCKEATSLGL